MPEFGPWVENELADADAAGAKVVVVKSGTSYRATGNAAHGPAILDANGHVISRLAYEGVADGVATLDANGKLAQPRRVLGAYLALQDDLYSTTTVVGDYVMPQPRISLDLPAGVTVILDAMLNLVTDGTNWALSRLVYSDDGGTTWTALDKYTGVYQANYHSVPLVGMQTISTAISRIYGITIGNASGHSDTIKSPPGYCLLRALVVDY